MRWRDKLVIFLSTGNRPIRILFFGGIFLAWLVMKLLSKLLGIDTDIEGDIGLSTVILISFSILAGFAGTYSLVCYLENARQRYTDHEE